MVLREIWIKDYKSINEWQKISLNSNLICITGKNGVGKTNLLEALQLIFLQNPYGIYNRPTKGLAYKLVLELTVEELSEIDSAIENTSDNKRLEVFCDANEDSLRPNRIRSKVIVNSLKEKVGNAKILLETIKKELEDYKTLTTQIITEEPFSSTFELGELDLRAHTNFMYAPKQLKEQLDSAIKEIEDIQTKIVVDEDSLDFISLRRYQVNYLFNISGNELQLKTLQPVLTPFQEKYIKIDYNGINQAIQQINAKLSSVYQSLKDNLNNFTRLCNSIDSLYGERLKTEYEEDELVQSLRKKIETVSHRNVYFLANTSSSLFFTREDERYTFYNYKYLIHAFWRYDCPDQADERINASQDKMSLSEREISRFEKMLNDTLPQFEKGLIKSVHVKSDGNNLKISLEEYSGTLIPLNQSNMGRRWYFTYYFLKRCLKNGDVFIIDEPATFLHPDAQLEILSELKELSEKGIQIFYSTHSPYMLPDKLSSLRVVAIEKTGTIIKELNNSQNYIDGLRNQIGVSNLNDFLLRIGKPIIFVEGEQDKACIESFMRIFDIEKSNFEIYPCYGDAVVTMAWTSMKIGLSNFKALLDYDNKNKPKSFLETHKDFSAHLEALENNHFVVFTSEDGEKKEIEDLFARQDRWRYLEKQGQKDKVSRKKLADLNPSAVEKETKENFRKLFEKLGLLPLDFS